MDCKKNDNKVECTCTYEPCSRKGLCCQCISYHRRRAEAPACLFPVETEKRMIAPCAGWPLVIKNKFLYYASNLIVLRMEAECSPVVL